MRPHIKQATDGRRSPLALAAAHNQAERVSPRCASFQCRLLGLSRAPDAVARGKRTAVEAARHNSSFLVIAGPYCTLLAAIAVQCAPDHYDGTLLLGPAELAKTNTAESTFSMRATIIFHSPHTPKALKRARASVLR